MIKRGRGKISLFREKLVCRFGFWDILTDGGKGIGEGFSGLGKLLLSLGNVVDSLGTSVQWIVSRSPKALYAMFLEGRNFADETWEKITEPDLPIELAEYAEAGFAFTVPDRPVVEDQKDGESDEVYINRVKEATKDFRVAWKNRIDKFLRPKIKEMMDESAPLESEYAAIDRAIKKINKANVARIVLTGNLLKQKKGIIERLDMADFPEGSPMMGEPTTAEGDIDEKLAKMDKEIDVDNQPWYVYNKETKKNEKKNISLTERKAELELELEEPRAEIKFYKDQIESIEFHYDPDGTRGENKIKREKRRLEAWAKAEEPLEKPEGFENRPHGGGGRGGGGGPVRPPGT